MTRRTYTARCQRSQGWWAIEIPDVVEGRSSIWTQARRLSQVEYMARDAIALMLEVPEDSFDVVVEPHIDEELEAEVAKARQLRTVADEAVREAQQALQTAARDLSAAYALPVRDIGELLGISFQRVSQLLRKSA